MNKEKLKLVLEALMQASRHVNNDVFVKVMMARDDVVEALAKPEQEPVAHIVVSREGKYHTIDIDWTQNEERLPLGRTPLYTTPPQRTWVGLTESDRRLMNFQWQDGNGTATEIIDLVEAKLKEKNGIAPQAKPAAQEGWKPIESAPKTRGQKILTWGRIPESYGYSEEKWLHSISEWEADGWISQTSIPFGNRFVKTHWMPLPPPPQGSDK